MLTKNWKIDSEKQDIRVVNFMMMRLMKSSINFKDLNLFELEYSDRWNNTIKYFLHKTDNSTCQHLLQIILV